MLLTRKEKQNDITNRTQNHNRMWPTFKEEKANPKNKEKNT